MTDPLPNRPVLERRPRRRKETHEVKRGGAKRPKSRMVSFRIDEEDWTRLEDLARQTSRSRAAVLRACIRGVRLKSTVDAQALHEVSRVHANLNRVGGLLKLAIREGVGDRAEHFRLNHELREAVREVSRAVERLAGLR